MLRNFIRLISCALATIPAFVSLASGAESTAQNITVLSEAFRIPGLDRERTVRLYLPPGYENAARQCYPVIYMHDAQNLFDDATSYAGEWAVDETLIRLGRDFGFHAIVVGIDHGSEKRTQELSPWTNPRFGTAEGREYLHFVVTVVKPYIDQHYRTLTGPENTAMVGSSLGGLMTHYAAHEYSQVFGKVAVLSPAYWFAPQVIEHTLLHPLPANSRLYLYIGSAEGEEAVTGANEMFALLTRQHAGHRTNLNLSVREGGEHNEAAWRAELPGALSWLFSIPDGNWLASTCKISSDPLTIAE
jgi:alpha-glucosidase